MVLLDTSFIVSFLVDSENNHERALELSKRLHGEKIVITNAVLTETVNILTKRLNRNTKNILKAYKSMKNKFKIIYEDEELTERSINTLIKYKANISLADALNIEVMNDFNIHEIFSFDDDFDNKEGIVRIY